MNPTARHLRKAKRFFKAKDGDAGTTPSEDQEQGPPQKKNKGRNEGWGKGQGKVQTQGQVSA